MRIRLIKRWLLVQYMSSHEEVIFSTEWFPAKWMARLMSPTDPMLRDNAVICHWTTLPPKVERYLERKRKPVRVQGSRR